MDSRLLLTIFLTISAVSAYAQERMTLSEAIRTARTNSVEALETRQAFISTYWAYRSYKANRLPGVNLNGNLMNFDRSLIRKTEHSNTSVPTIYRTG